MTKKIASFFQEKIGVTPLVAAPGDTHPSDATAWILDLVLRKVIGNDLNGSYQIVFIG